MRFFFYGTLIAASDTPAARRLQPKVRDEASASVAGRLVAIHDPRGPYPALLPGRPGERVRGVVCTLGLSAGDLGWLDRYEGSEYRRLNATIIRDDGVREIAWLYRWRAAVPPGAERIRDGDFLRWLAANGQRGYGA